MKKSTSFLICIFTFFIVVSTPAQSITRKVLFLGNSYTYVNNLPQVIADISSSTGDSLIFDSNTPGGYTLFQHYTDSSSLNKIIAGGWDYVVLQEQSQLPALDVYDDFAAGGLCSLVNKYNPCARRIFYMTWGRKNGDASNCAAWPPVCTYEGMDSLLRLRYIETASTYKTEISPVGAVWRYIRQNFPNIDLYQADESHPSVAGTYAAACSFYASLFKKDPSLVPYDYVLSASDAASIRNAAKVIVYDSLANWDFGDYTPVADFYYTIGSGINEVNFYNNSTNADSIEWDFGDTSFSNINFPVHNYSADGLYTITLTAKNCDLSQIYLSTKQKNINFCSYNPTVFPDSLIICPNSHDTLWTQVYDSYQWLDAQGNIIPNETNQFFVPPGGNNYSVLVTQNGCSELSPQIFVGQFINGLVSYNVDTISNSIHTDTLCMGDTLKLFLRPNKPSSYILNRQWLNNGIPIPNSDFDTLVITSSGSYSISVINTICPGHVVYDSQPWSFSFINCNIGIIENEMTPFISVYPNPSENIFNIKIDAALIGSNYSINDILGKTLMKGKFDNENYTLNLKDFCRGIYFLVVDKFKNFTVKLNRE